MAFFFSVFVFEFCLDVILMQMYVLAFSRMCLGEFC